MNPTTNLLELAQAANAAHDHFEHLAREALDHAQTAGAALAQAKASLPHGQFESWIKENVSFSARTARVYMRISENWDKITEWRTESPNLSLRDAIDLLASPRNEEVENGNALPLLQSGFCEDLSPNIDPDDRLDPVERQQLLDACADECREAYKGHEIDELRLELINSEIGRACSRRELNTLLARYRAIFHQHKKLEASEDKVTEVPIRLPAPGNILIGSVGSIGLDERFVIIESSPFNDGYCRTAVTDAEGFTFDTKTIIRWFIGRAINSMGIAPDSIKWIKELPATPENNPLHDFLPEWRYPVGQLPSVGTRMDIANGDEKQGSLFD